MVELQQFLDHSNINTTREYLQAISMIYDLKNVANNEWEKAGTEAVMNLIRNNLQLKTIVTSLLRANGVLN